MNCCDEYGDCRQGRDCPARTQGAKVAKVGRRAPKHAQPLRRTIQRAYLKDLARAMLFALAMVFLSMAVLFCFAMGLSQ